MALPSPGHLLDQAHRLTAPLGPGAPRQTDLRRAISSAYYGVFHAVVAAAADDFAGRTKRHTPRYALVYRSIQHKTLRALCEDIVKSNLPAKYQDHVPKGGFGTDLEAFANAVVDLHEKRHKADYDPRYRVSTSDAVLAVATGRTALSLLTNANRTRKKAFLSVVVFPPRSR